jgi:hypothetical protein
VNNKEEVGSPIDEIKLAASEEIKFSTPQIQKQIENSTQDKLNTDKPKESEEGKKLQEGRESRF